MATEVRGTGFGTERVWVRFREQEDVGFLDLQIKKKKARRIVKTKKLAIAASTAWRVFSIWVGDEDGRNLR